MKKELIGIFVCMLFVGTVLPVTGTIITNDRPTLSSQDGKTLYVGGSGEGNYTRIQDAINDSVNGDTVFVYDDSSPYYENVVINKSISLIGENKETTVIDGDNIGDVVNIKANRVDITGFTIKNGSWYTEDHGAGIHINSDYCKVTNNIISHNSYHGLEIYMADNCYISGNIISYNRIGIYIHLTDQVIIEDNIIQENSRAGIGIFSNLNVIKILNNIIVDNGWYGLDIGRFRDSVIIRGNYISRNGIGIRSSAGMQFIIDRTYISENIISWNTDYGMYIESSKGNLIYKNNFENNGINAFMGLRVGWCGSGVNRWCYLLRGNYWDDWPGSGPKIINGEIYLNIVTHTIIIPWINIDLFPVSEPYDIGI